MTLIQQLSEGKIALHNTGTFEELKRVLEVAFPMDKYADGEKTWRHESKYFKVQDHLFGNWINTNTTDLPSYPTSKFIQELDKQSTTMRKITYEQGQLIIDNACPTWQRKLYNKWGEAIVFKRDIEISEDEYRGMRKACTPQQHKLFDGIFGEDKPQFKVGDWVVVFRGVSLDSKEQDGKCLRIKELEPKGILLEGARHGGIHNGEVYPIECRLATPEEIKKAELFTAKKGDWVVIVKGCFSDFSENKIYQLDRDFVQGETDFAVVADDCGDVNRIFAQYLGDCKFRFATPEEIKKATALPEGTPCFVRDSIEQSWELMYANGKGRFFRHGKKSGSTYTWGYVHEYSKGLPEE
jgi:hypothetical protein